MLQEFKMDNFADDEKKFGDIRKTIREVILPLVQAIYLEEPSDVTCFCAQYFESILQKRENSSKEADERESSTVSDEQSASKDGNLSPQIPDEETTDISKGNIQGSVSLPLLTADKKSEGLTLRETSSWNETSHHSHSARKNPAVVYSFIDAVRGIGDQPSPLKSETEGTEIKIEEGETIEKAIKFADKNGSENQHMMHIRDDSPEECAPCVIPSAPPYEYGEEHMNNKFPGMSTPYINQVSFDLQEKQSDSKEANEHPKILPEDSESFSCFVKNVTVGKEENMKICRGELSPNSSFGFIPYLKDVKLEEKEKNVQSQNSVESNHREKSAIEIEELTKQCSEAFTDLAEELESAESYLNEFLKVKEIGDIIKGKDQMKGDKSANEKGEPVGIKSNVNEATFTETTDEYYCAKDNTSEAVEKVSENESIRYTEKSYPKSKEIGDIIKGKDQMKEDKSTNEKGEPTERKAIVNEATFAETTDAYYCAKDSTCEVVENVSEKESMRYTEESYPKVNDLEGINNSSANKSACLPDNNIETSEDCKECERDNKSTPANFEQSKGCQEYIPISSQNNTLKEEDRCYSESRPTIDANWRRRWYEAHPRIDNTHYFRQRLPLVHRGRRINFSSHRNKIFPNIGEAGDVPLDRRFRRVQDEASESLGCSSESNIDTNSFSFSLDADSVNSASSHSVDGTYYRLDEGMSTRTFSDRSQMTTNTGISSQSIPYSWRRMSSKQNTLPDQSSGRILKDPRLKVEDVSDSKKSCESDKNVISVTSHELESLKEIRTLTEDESHEDSLRSHKLEPDPGTNESDNVKHDEKQKVSKENFAKVITATEEGLQYSSTVNSQELDDSKNKQCSNIDIGNFTKNSNYYQVIQPNQAFASEQEHFYDTYEQFADFSKGSYQEQYSNKEIACGEQYYAKKTEEYLQFMKKDDEEAEIKVTDSSLTPLDEVENSNASQTFEKSVKVEPGLNSACGDSVLSNTAESSDRSVNPYTSDTSSANVSDSLVTIPNHPVESIQGINSEYFESIMGRILEQNDSLEDDYNGLNFSSYSENESSDLEEASDLSETDDMNLNKIAEQ